MTKEFEDRIVFEFRIARRYDEPLSLLSIESDVRQATEIINTCLRETDSVSLSRPGIYDILLPRTHLAGALTVAERLRQQFMSANGTCWMSVTTYPHRPMLDSSEFISIGHAARELAKRNAPYSIHLVPAV